MASRQLPQPPRASASCPCGSGLESRFCCALPPAARARLEQERSLHLRDREVLDAVFERIPTLRSIDWFTERVDEFFGGSEPDERSDLFTPWLLLARHGSSCSLVEDYVNHRLLPAETRAWLDAQSVGRLSVWRVIQPRWPRGVKVRDLLTGEDRFVSDVIAAVELRVDHHVLSRVVDFDKRSYFCGGYPGALPPKPAARITRGFTAAHGGAVGLGPELLRGAAAQLELIGAWHELYAEGELPDAVESPP